MLSPLPASKWNYATAAHLLNRAAFGGSPEEIQKLAAMPHAAAVNYLVDFEKIPDPDAARPDWAHPDPERINKYQEARRAERDAKDGNMTDAEREAGAEKRRQTLRALLLVAVKQMQELRYDWLNRMAFGPRPFQEKLALFWHGHFATSAVKVKNPYFMWVQIDTFRGKGKGNWLDLLEAMATDPAMLVWLDQAQSRRQHPNENFARESMELFALGEGHYTEKDVTEAARAMTGWSLDRLDEKYVYRPAFHDKGEKTVLGQTGNFTGHEVLEIIVNQPQAAVFITGKLWKFFGAETMNKDLAAALAKSFRENGNNFEPFLKTMFLSEEFYAPDVMHNQIKSPVQWLVNSVRLLQRDMPPSIVATQMTQQLGQELLLPPNVKGWDGGLSWITTNTLLARYNEAAILVMGQGNLGATGDKPLQKFVAERANRQAQHMRPSNAAKLVPEADRDSAKAIVAHLEKRFILGELTEKHRKTLYEYLDAHEEKDDDTIRHCVRLLMSTPEYQLT